MDEFPDLPLPALGTPCSSSAPKGTLILLNGPCGVGKTSAAWALLDTMYATVLLDGDNFGAINPYRLEDPRREAYLFETLSLIIRHHLARGYRNFIIPYVYAGPAAVSALLQNLSGIDLTIWRFRLDASPGALSARIEARDSVDCRWELRRGIELRRLFEGPWHDPEELLIDTTDIPPAEVVFRIKRWLFDAAACQPLPPLHCGSSSGSSAPDTELR